ncbi:hypothetical protein L3X38_000266 (mitochondrion) [Prunus dulcis]|uniref:Uncharacterized protein n=1 Tax=Prunus dulcis TaxID=3755 RepID=A0AAD4UR56_PRUDU|nr:hypothetical protein L3X38_000266 [Prunus dulcis]
MGQFPILAAVDLSPVQPQSCSQQDLSQDYRPASVSSRLPDSSGDPSYHSVISQTSIRSPDVSSSVSIRCIRGAKGVRGGLKNSRNGPTGIFTHRRQVPYVSKEKGLGSAAGYEVKVVVRHRRCPCGEAKAPQEITKY